MYQTNYYKQGEAFENVVQDLIFSQFHYDLVERTHNYDQNQKRFVESSRNPDFKFREKKSGQEFYVEAKYRSGFNEDEKLILFKEKQFKRFQVLNSIEHPVFVIVGIGGPPSQPFFISLIALSELKYPTPFKSIILNHVIHPQPCNPKLILEATERFFPKQELT